MKFFTFSRKTKTKQVGRKNHKNQFFIPLCGTYVVIDRSRAESTQVVQRLLSTINCSNCAATITINTENQHFEWGKISGKSKKTRNGWARPRSIPQHCTIKLVYKKYYLDH